MYKMIFGITPEKIEQAQKDIVLALKIGVIPIKKERRNIPKKAWKWVEKSANQVFEEEYPELIPDKWRNEDYEYRKPMKASKRTRFHKGMKGAEKATFDFNKNLVEKMAIFVARLSEFNEKSLAGNRIKEGKRQDLLKLMNVIRGKRNNSRYNKDTWEELLNLANLVYEEI